MYKNPRPSKATHTLLHLGLCFQSHLADHILPLSHTAPFLVLTCPSRSLFSSGLSNELPSPSFLKAIDKCCATKARLRDGKTHHTHKVFTPEIGELCMKKMFFGILLEKDLLLFGTFRTRLIVFFKDMLFLMCWNLKPSSHLHNEVHWLTAWS